MEMMGVTMAVATSVELVKVKVALRSARMVAAWVEAAKARVLSARAAVVAMDQHLVGAEMECWVEAVEEDYPEQAGAAVTVLGLAKGTEVETVLADPEKVAEVAMALGLGRWIGLVDGRRRRWRRIGRWRWRRRRLRWHRRWRGKIRWRPHFFRSVTSSILQTARASAGSHPPIQQ